MRWSPMPFGWVPIRHEAMEIADRLDTLVSPMPFGWVPIRHNNNNKKHHIMSAKSPMPFGWVPIRHEPPCRRHPLHQGGVSNAFRLGAYPALRAMTPHSPPPATCLQCLSAGCLSGTRRIAYVSGPGLRESPMPFGWVPIRHGANGNAVAAADNLSPMPFGWVPIRHNELSRKMQMARGFCVSNAFRLGA